MAYNQLSPQEAYVILEKGTEAPFSGKFYKNEEQGVYVCRQCNAPLFNLEDKFESGSGWPSFDDEIDGAVKRIADAVGYLVGIVCADCGGHLGPVF